MASLRPVWGKPGEDAKGPPGPTSCPDGFCQLLAPGFRRGPPQPQTGAAKSAPAARQQPVALELRNGRPAPQSEAPVAQSHFREAATQVEGQYGPADGGAAQVAAPQATATQ